MTPPQIVICVILGRKKGRDMCQNAFSSCLQGVRIRRSKRGTGNSCMMTGLLKTNLLKQI